MQDQKTNEIFIFGLCILGAWMIMIIICANPKLFRDIFSRLCFRSIARRRKAKSRMHYAKCLPLTNMIAIEPSNIMLTQAFGKNLPLLNESDKKEGTHLESTVQLDDVNI